jgi:phosphatidylinositol-3-phosphatase
MASIFVYSRGPAERCGFLAILLLVLVCIGCGGGGSSMNTTTTGSPAPSPSGGFPQFGHVVLVVEENASYSQVIGNLAMPYLNTLATQYGLATQYYANTHPSIGNYFMLTTGQLVTTNDGLTGTVNVDNIVRELLAAGKTWKSYAESRGDPNLYVQRHDPCSFFTDVVDNSMQMQNLVSFSQFGVDVANDALPNFSFVVPNLQDDAHDGPLSQADAWLKTNIAPLVSNTTFRNDGLLIITFDESVGTDTQNGGGHVATVIVSPKAKAGFQSTTLYQHQSTLRLILQGLGVSNLPGASSSAPQMGEFF